MFQIQRYKILFLELFRFSNSFEIRVFLLWKVVEKLKLDLVTKHTVNEHKR